MHGTFHGRIENEDGLTVHFAARLAAHPTTLDAGPRMRRATFPMLLAGCCLVFFPNSASPTDSPKIGPSPVAGHKRVTLQGAGVALASSFAAVGSPAQPRVSHLPVGRSASHEPVSAAELIPLPVRTAPLHARVGDSERPSSPPPELRSLAITTQGMPLAAVNLAEPSALSSTDVELPKTQASTITSPTEELRAVDIAQISTSELSSQRLPQSDKPHLVAGVEPALSAKIAAMQVTPLPPVRVRDSERLAMLVDAPTQMTLRIGRAEFGKVDFRISETHTIDVKVAGLLDLLASHYDAVEFARVRSSAAADAYVSFDQLRALGLNVHYDAIYDELRING